MAQAVCPSDRWTSLSGAWRAETAAVLDAVPGTAAYLDSEGVIRAINRAWRRFSVENGRPNASRDIGLDYAALCEAADGADAVEGIKVARGIRGVLAGRLDRFTQLYPCHAPWEERWFRCEVRPVYGDSGPVGAIVSHVDVTDEVISANDKDVRLHRMAEVSGALGAYWWDWNLARDAVDLSAELRARLNLPDRGPVASEALRACMHSADRPQAVRTVRRALAGSEDHYEHEYRVITADGPIWVHVRGQILRDDAGTARRVVGIALNVQNARALSVQLEREREHNRKLALVADKTDNGVVISDAAGRVEWVNAAFERLCGYSLAELQGQWPGDLLSGPATDPAMHQALVGVVQSGQGTQVRVANYRKDGRPYWAEVDLQPVRNAEGAVEHHIGVERDVTRSQREDGLHRAREIGLQHTLDGDRLADTLPDVLRPIQRATIDVQAAVLRLDRARGKLRLIAAPDLPEALARGLDGLPLGALGRSPGVAVATAGAATTSGRRLRARDLARRSEWLALAPADALAGLEACWLEPVVGLEGSVVGLLALFYGRPMEDDAETAHYVERIAHLIGTLIEREQKELALRRSERHFRELAEVLPSLVSYVTHDWRYGHTNPAYDDFMGVPRGSLKGTHVRNQFDSETWPEVERHARRALEGERVSFETERAFANGRRRQLIATYIPDRDESGAVAGFYAVIDDITEFRRREAELHRAKEAAQASSAAKSAFLANMSHELRTPLNAIIGYSEIMSQQLLGPIGNDKYKDYIEDIYDSGRYLLELIEDVLELSTLDAEGRHLTSDAVELSVAVRQALVVLGLADGARVIADLDDDAVAWGDVRALKQVVVNLVGNALKYGGDGPVRVETAAGADGGPCRLTVSDTGPGIPASELPRVTEPFYTVDKDSWVANDRGGTGIGLALVKRLVEEMDGQLTIDSVEGAGTTVEVHLPQVSLAAQV